MYQRARKLGDLMGNDPSNVFTLAEQQLEAYLVAINSLSLVDEDSAWVLLPSTVESADHASQLFPFDLASLIDQQPRKRRKLSKHIPEGKFAPGNYDTEIVHLNDIQYDYALLSAQIDLAQRDPTLVTFGVCLAL